MPVSYGIAGDRFHLVMEGSYSPADIKQVFLRALEDPAFPERPRFVFDVSRSDVLAERSADQIRAMVRFLSENAERFGRRCAVVVSRPVQYGLSRMGTAFVGSDDVEVEVFTDIDDAFAWLDTDRAD